jgi:hypothetical protein
MFAGLGLVVFMAPRKKRFTHAFPAQTAMSGQLPNSGLYLSPVFNRRME